MLILNVDMVFAWRIIYGYLVKHRVEKLLENQVLLSSPASNSRDICEFWVIFSMFCNYVTHLFVARLIGLLAILLSDYFRVNTKLK